MKTKEELNTLKEELETVNRKLSELSEDELDEVTGGVRPLLPKGLKWPDLIVSGGKSTEDNKTEVC